MPPKPKFTKEEIINAALDFVRENGIEALTARSLGDRLGSSARPIFTVFENMEELTENVKNAAVEDYTKYISDSVNYTPAFKQFGIRMIQYAKMKPKLFQLIFMQEHSGIVSFEDLVFQSAQADVCIDIIEHKYSVKKEDARIIFRQTLLSNFGICCLIASNACRFSEKDIDEYLGASFAGALLFAKCESRDYFKIHPEKNNNEDNNENNKK